MDPRNFRINSMDEISSLCHCIAKKINLHICVRNICNHTRKFKIFLDLIGYISMKLLEFQETDTETGEFRGSYKSEDLWKVCSKHTNQTVSEYTYKLSKLRHHHTIGNNTLAFCRLRKLWYQAFSKYFSKMINEPKFCRIRKINRLLDLKSKVNTRYPMQVKSRKLNTKFSSATSILANVWSIWLCLLVSVILFDCLDRKCY